MSHLVLFRHGETDYNKDNIFTGWLDVPMNDKGIEEVQGCAVLLKEYGLDFDVCFCSFLKRSIDSLNIALDVLDRCWLPVIKAYQLNERHYGALQGLSKTGSAETMGNAYIFDIRRTYHTVPPLMDRDGDDSPYRDERYRGLEDLPLGESIEMTMQRIYPYFRDNILPLLKSGADVLVSLHANSMRALLKGLLGISDEEIISLYIPTGVPMLLEYDDQGKLTDSRYLGDQQELKERTSAMKIER